MSDPFKEMTCYILAGGKENSQKDFTDVGGLTRLEKGYRRYAAIFEQVRLVLKKDQAREKYLNYPHVCDETPDHSALEGVRTALEDAPTDAVFVGSSEIMDFPLELLVNLVKNYNGESYLGYSDSHNPDGSHQPLFAIYNRRLAPKLHAAMTDGSNSLDKIAIGEGRTIPLPEDVSAELLGLN